MLTWLWSKLCKHVSHLQERLYLVGHHDTSSIKTSSNGRTMWSSCVTKRQRTFTCSQRTLTASTLSLCWLLYLHSLQHTRWWMHNASYTSCCFLFSVRLLSVLRGHSLFSSPPQRPITSDFEGFSIPDFIDYIYFPILVFEKEPVFPFLIFSAKQANHLVPFL